MDAVRGDTTPSQGEDAEVAVGSQESHQNQEETTELLSPNPGEETRVSHGEKPSPSTSTPLRKRTNITPKGKSLHAFLKRTGGSILSKPFRSKRGSAFEQKKVVVDESFKLALIRCSIHVLPVLGTVVLAAMNIKGYFVGSEFAGLHGEKYTALVNLLLQVTAKAMELLIIASLASVILDVIRHETLFGEEGIPLGLLAGNHQFTNVAYLWSPAFWSGKGGMKPRLRKWLILTLIFVSGIIAALSGPFTALLMIPTVRDNWPAGGSSLWLIGNEAANWPDNLSLDTVGGSHCLNPTEEMVQGSGVNTTGCIWHSTSFVAGVMKKWTQLAFISTTSRNLTIHERGFDRAITVSYTPQETWATTTSASVAAISYSAAYYWTHAVNYAPIVSKVFGEYSRLKHGARALTRSQLESKLPAVRVSCNTFERPYGYDKQIRFPVLLDVVGQKWSYVLSPKFVNSSMVLSQWVSVPTSPTLTTNGTMLADHPSAFLTIQIPISGNSTTRIIVACSVGAYWVLGHNMGTNIRARIDRSFVHSGVIDYEYYKEPGYRPTNNEVWTKIAIDRDWLYTLTPRLESNTSKSNSDDVPSWSSLASLLSDAKLDNSTGLVQNWYNVGPQVEEATSLLIVEGMARVGYTSNGGFQGPFKPAEHESDVMDFGPLYSDERKNSILQGEGAFDPPSGLDASELTKLYWGVTTTGLSYLSDSAAYYVALAVLFIYLAIALGHTIFSLWRKQSSEAWDSFEELLLLGYGSEKEPGVLANTSVGVTQWSTLKTLVKIRAQVSRPRHEEVQMVIGNIETDTKAVELGKVYGALD